MTLARTLIRQQVRSLLAAKAATSGSPLAPLAGRIYDARFLPSNEKEAPSLFIWTLSETAGDVWSLVPYQQVMTADLKLNLIHALPDASVLGAVEALEEAIRNTLTYSLGMPAVVRACRFAGTQFDPDPKGAATFMNVTLNYEVEYIASEGGVINTADIPDLRTVHTDIDLIRPTGPTGIGPDGQVEASLDILYPA